MDSVMLVFLTGDQLHGARRARRADDDRVLVVIAAHHSFLL
jgi:hypothetical protein